MKVVILAGGFGTRISEETDLIPKPMIEIGGKPILWHIMKIYSQYGLNEFIILLGYKGYLIKEYFANYFLHHSDITINLSENTREIHLTNVESWKITLIDTGLNTMTGGRIKKIQRFFKDETFMLTYGDGVGDINIFELLNYHRKNGKLATVTTVQPSGKFGALNLDNQGVVSSFREKPKSDNSWVNGGFFVLEPEIFNYIKDENIIWEKEPLENLAKDGQLVAYKHYGFWKPMDTLNDKKELERLWNSDNAPWQIWDDQSNSYNDIKRLKT
ncbi:MAG: glucose-1-phosphate cytidylyltransferase [Candidatus Melainabacteria bacterium GWA2_34_9]|nr:MAG: glucose-1-phosphate cytidylyltransferase [Candidatus Melainabacteria bacterium GWA2_34_9]